MSGGLQPNTRLGEIAAVLRQPVAFSAVLYALLAGVVAGSVSFVLPKTYKAEAKILPTAPTNSAVSVVSESRMVTARPEVCLGLRNIAPESSLRRHGLANWRCFRGEAKCTRYVLHGG